MPEPFLITHPASGTAQKAPTAQWRVSLPELRNRLAHGQLWGLAQSLGDLMDVLALLCILRVEEQEEAERQAADEFNGTTLDNEGNPRPLLPRSFTSLSQAEEENGQSRIYLGIHWSFDKTEGIAQGRRVGDFVFDHAFVPSKHGQGNSN